MARSGSSVLYGWARWGLLAVTLAMTVALITTAWAGRRRVDEASELLVIGQTSAFFRSLFESLKVERNFGADELAAFHADNQEFGVRYVDLRERDGTILRAGAPETPVPDRIEDWQGPPQRTSRIGDRVRVIARMPPRRPPATDRPGPPPAPTREPDRSDPHWPAFVVLEFEPVIGNRLRDDASRAFALNAAVAGVFVLITATLWRLLRQREESEARAEREHRLALLGEMSAVLAHEIRNPLASLKGHAQLLAEQLETESPARRKADRVIREAERIEALSGSLLDFVRSGSIEPKEVSPADLVASSAASVDARFAIDASQAPSSFRLDPLRMQQVLTNLMENAAQNNRGESPIDVAIRGQRAGLDVTVRDRGLGIPAGEEERVFQPFHTTRARGVGLGLAVARRIVELHGGTLTAANHPDGGAVFTISIPAS
jgi:two-component system sensor histidine kinase HydH